LINALSLLTQAAYAEASDGGFSAPSIDEFYPQVIAFQGTWFELDRIMLIRLLVMTALIVLFWLWSSKFKKSYKNNILVPSRFQLMGEISLKLRSQEHRSRTAWRKRWRTLFAAAYHNFLLDSGHEHNRNHSFLEYRWNLANRFTNCACGCGLRNFHLRRCAKTPLQVLHCQPISCRRSKAVLHLGDADRVLVDLHFAPGNPSSFVSQ
jgi:hypothetical protein